MITALFVILSEGRSPKSKDLRTIILLCIGSVRRSFDSLRSLRMTNSFGHRPFRQNTLSLAIVGISNIMVVYNHPLMKEGID